MSAIARDSRTCVYEDLFLPSQRCLMPHSWGTPCNINAIYSLYIAEK